MEIYGISFSLLPERRKIVTSLHEPFYVAWRERHRSVRDERSARASLGGLLLLQSCGIEGELVYGENGRPYLRDSAIDFNITHTEQNVFLAVERATPDPTAFFSFCVDSSLPPYPSLSVPASEKKVCFAGQARVGIDAEDIARLSHVRICPMAERWFTENEQAFFYRDPSELSFLRVWTRKESLVKWMGEGLRALREADTVLAESMYGVRFYEYAVEDSWVTLCCSCHSRPPQTVQMLSYASLSEMGFLLS